MSSTKVVILVLVLLAVVYIVFVSKGALSGEKQKPVNKDDAMKFIKEGKTPPWAKSLGGFFTSRRPKLVLKYDRYTANSEETVKPDADHPFRNATFHLMQGTAHIKYVDSTEDADDLKDQEFDLPCLDNKDDIRKSSIVALKSGGNLTITCTSNPCRIDIE
ncbi:MAG: hypothetical protein QOH96_2866 [Blastocatellia bacterium]|nr:hypothetical protein [Blastocatellia bacterium]